MSKSIEKLLPLLDLLQGVPAMSKVNGNWVSIIDAKVPLGSVPIALDAVYVTQRDPGEWQVIGFAHPLNVVSASVKAVEALKSLKKQKAEHEVSADNDNDPLAEVREALNGLAGEPTLQ